MPLLPHLSAFFLRFSTMGFITFHPLPLFQRLWGCGGGMERVPHHDTISGAVDVTLILSQCRNEKQQHLYRWAEGPFLPLGESSRIKRPHLKRPPLTLCFSAGFGIGGGNGEKIIPTAYRSSQLMDCLWVLRGKKFYNFHLGAFFVCIFCWKMCYVEVIILMFDISQSTAGLLSWSTLRRFSPGSWQYFFMCIMKLFVVSLYHFWWLL